MPSFKSILTLKSLSNALKTSSSSSKAIQVISEPTFVRAASEIVLPDGTVSVFSSSCLFLFLFPTLEYSRWHRLLVLLLPSLPSLPSSPSLPPSPLLQVLHDVTRAFHVADDARERARKLNKAKTAAIPPLSSSSGSSSIPASKPIILTGLGLVLWFEDKDEVKVDATVTVQKQSDSERVWWAW
jgi:hypothetical protein